MVSVLDIAAQCADILLLVRLIADNQRSWRNGRIRGAESLPIAAIRSQAIGRQILRAQPASADTDAAVRYLKLGAIELCVC
nr:hypothetical protein [Pectobacterium colocasium]